MEKWYSKSYRRNLVDMHIDDWNPEFLSKFSPEEYFENLKRAHIQSPMIYFQSHAGHCYFPTKVGHMHSALIGREDMIKRLTELCHDAGMNVVGYYSLIFNTYEEDRHPEWRLVTGEDGTSDRQRGSRYGHCCPNNPEYREFVRAQIKEMADYFRVDGMFYDMTYWSGLCRCPHCMEIYKKAGIGSIPTRDFADPQWMKLMQLRLETMGDFARFVTETTHEFMPGVSVEHNYAHGVAADSIEIGTSELVNDQCDYTGGDLYGDLYNHSFTAKYYLEVSKNQPFEYMTCRCDRSLAAHTVSKPEERLATEIMLTAAHHGASFVIDAIDPVGTLDKRVYERLGRVFERQMPYEKYFGGKLRADVGVWYSVTGRYNPVKYQTFTSKTCSVGATRALIERHIPVGVISDSTTDRANEHKLIIAGGIAGISDKNRADIAEYVKNGGILYISGAADPELLKLMLNADLVRYTDESSVYLAPTEAGKELFGEFNADYPLPTELSLPVLGFGDRDYEVLATMKLPYTKSTERRFASIHSNPPGVMTDIPALIVRNFGNGKVVWSAAPIENDGRLSHNKLLCDLVESMIKPSLTTNAPRQVELTSFDADYGVQVCAVDLLCSDELLPIRDFSVSIETDKPTHVICVDGENEYDIPFEYSDGRVNFTVKSLVMFGMYKILK